jgi:hypothetical protein
VLIEESGDGDRDRLANSDFPLTIPIEYPLPRSSYSAPSASPSTSCPSLPLVGEFRKTRHPRNIKFDKVLETCFSETGNSQFSEAWDLRSLGFANVRSSGIVIRGRRGVANMQKPGTTSWRWHGPTKKRRPIRESVGDPVRESRVKTFTNR